MSSLPPCRPPFWAKGSHAQTILSYYLPYPEPPAGAERVEIPVSDGDRLVGFFYRGTQPIVVVAFHGLSGSSESRYMRRTAILCRKLGYSCLLMNHRGCGAGKGLARGPYHSGRGEDASEVFRYLKGRLPDHKRIGVGFSLGGNALLALLSGIRGSEFPEAAVAVNAPIQLDRSAHQLCRGWNKLYDSHFVKMCLQSVEERRRSGLIGNEYTFPRKMTLMDFDDFYTAPAGGFRDRHDYYDSCSTAGRLHRISVPTVLIMSKDDPFIDYRDYTGAKLSPKVRLHLEPHGGHMGYLTQGPDLHWLNLALEHYLLELEGLSYS